MYDFHLNWMDLLICKFNIQMMKCKDRLKFWPGDPKWLNKKVSNNLHNKGKSRKLPIWKITQMSVWNQSVAITNN